MEVTSANVHDVEMTPKLMTGDESEIYGDSGYIGAEKRQDAIIRNRQGKKIRYKQNRKPTQIKKLSVSGQWKAKKAEHQKGKSRARICGHKGAVPVSKNAIPGSAKTDRQTEYAVRAGELGSG